jgi:hypothetical protein
MAQSARRAFQHPAATLTWPGGSSRSPSTGDLPLDRAWRRQIVFRQVASRLGAQPFAHPGRLSSSLRHRCSPLSPSCRSTQPDTEIPLSFHCSSDIHRSVSRWMKPRSGSPSFQLAARGHAGLRTIRGRHKCFDRWAILLPSHVCSSTVSVDAAFCIAIGGSTGVDRTDHRRLIISSRLDGEPRTPVLERLRQDLIPPNSR